MVPCVFVLKIALHTYREDVLAYTAYFSWCGQKIARSTQQFFEQKYLSNEFWVG